jgi:hypothetical protein
MDARGGSNEVWLTHVLGVLISSMGRVISHRPLRIPLTDSGDGAPLPSLQ